MLLGHHFQNWHHAEAQILPSACSSWAELKPRHFPGFYGDLLSKEIDAHDAVLAAPHFSCCRIPGNSFQGCWINSGGGVEWIAGCPRTSHSPHAGNILESYERDKEDFSQSPFCTELWDISLSFLFIVCNSQAGQGTSFSFAGSKLHGFGSPAGFGPCWFQFV